jgi:thiamine pyrophosphokinase
LYVGQRTVLVVAGGDRAATAMAVPQPDLLVVAADSGVDFAYEMGWRVDVAIGDFDSITSEGLARATAEGARIERRPAAKDQTDLELALDEALRLGASDMIVLGVGGGRLDHLLANLLVLAAPRFARCRITALDGAARVHVVRGQEPATVLLGDVGEVVTLLPVGGDASGISTEGLRYQLRGESLPTGTSRGVSNVIATLPASVQLEAGTLLAVFPGQGAS